MTTWQQGPPMGYPGQGPPPPAGFVPPSGYPQQSAYPFQTGYPTGFQPGAPTAPPSYDTVYGGPPPSQGEMYGTGYASEPANDITGFEFSDKAVRHGFIRKVYGILMCQLLVTFGIISFFLFHEPTRMYVARNYWVWILAIVLVITSLLVIVCSGNARRKSPLNFILLGFFTLAESVVLGCTCSQFKSEEVFMAVGITAAVCFALSIFAFQTRWDFTVLGAGLFVCLVILIIFGFIAIFIPGKTVTIVYGSLGALLFSIYLIYDTQLMMGGKHKYSISPEEYVFAALNLYLDIINIFVYILSIIGASRD